MISESFISNFSWYQCSSPFEKLHQPRLGLQDSSSGGFIDGFHLLKSELASKFTYFHLWFFSASCQNFHLIFWSKSILNLQVSGEACQAKASPDYPRKILKPLQPYSRWETLQSKPGSFCHIWIWSTKASMAKSGWRSLKEHSIVSTWTSISQRIPL